MSRVIITLVVVFVPLPALAQTAGQPLSQTQCSLTVAESPAIRGLKLGLSAEQLLSLFPGSLERPEIKNAIDNAQGSPNYGVARLSFRSSAYSSTFRDRFTGVDSIDVELFDGKVARFRVTYLGPLTSPRGPRWPNVDGFIARLSEAFALPDPENWNYVSSDFKTLKCNGFEIRASNPNASGSILFSTAFEKTAWQRAEAEEERRRREFKP